MSTKAKTKRLSKKNSCPFHPEKPLHYIKYTYVVDSWEDPETGQTKRKNQPIGTLWCPLDPPTKQYLPSEYLKAKRKIDEKQAQENNS